MTSLFIGAKSSFIFLPPQLQGGQGEAGPGGPGGPGGPLDPGGP